MQVIKKKMTEKRTHAHTQVCQFDSSSINDPLENYFFRVRCFIECAMSSDDEEDSFLVSRPKKKARVLMSPDAKEAGMFSF